MIGLAGGWQDLAVAAVVVVAARCKLANWDRTRAARTVSVCTPTGANSSARVRADQRATSGCRDGHSIRAGLGSIGAAELSDWMVAAQIDGLSLLQFHSLNSSSGRWSSLAAVEFNKRLNRSGLTVSSPVQFRGGRSVGRPAGQTTARMKIEKLCLDVVVVVGARCVARAPTSGPTSQLRLTSLPLDQFSCISPRPWSAAATSASAAANLLERVSLPRAPAGNCRLRDYWTGTSFGKTLWRSWRHQEHSSCCRPPSPSSCSSGATHRARPMIGRLSGRRQSIERIDGPLEGTFTRNAHSARASAVAVEQSVSWPPPLGPDRRRRLVTRWMYANRSQSAPQRPPSGR